MPMHTWATRRLGATALVINLAACGQAVSLDGGLQDPPATTSAPGFYMICSIVGGDQFRDSAAQRTGYIPITRRIFGGWDYEINLELGRR